MHLLNHAARRTPSLVASYIEDIYDLTVLSPNDERELASRIQVGDMEARDRMVKANLRLVIAIARRFVGRGLSLSDLIQEGNLGLVHAVERFDPSLNTRFSTYAKYWIEETLSRAAKRATGPVRVSAYANVLLCNWRNAVNDLHEQLNRLPTDEEVAIRLQLTRRQLALVQKAQRIHNSVTQLGSRFDNRATCDQVESREPPPDASVAADDEMRHVIELLDRLPEREATILRLHYGLSGSDPMSLLEIGEQLDLTRERVRQLEKRALVRLRDFIEA